jgi:hypothetical protein
VAWPVVLSVALAITTGLPLISSSILTVPEGTPPEPVTVTVSVVNVVVIWLVEFDVGQVCVLDCAESAVEVVVREIARATGTSASAKPIPATQ